MCCKQQGLAHSRYSLNISLYHYNINHILHLTVTKDTSFNIISVALSLAHQFGL